MFPDLLLIYPIIYSQTMDHSGVLIIAITKTTTIIMIVVVGTLEC